MNGTTSYRHLDFDEALFGHPVAILDEVSMPLERLTDTLEELRARGVCLVYWPCAPTRDNDATALAAGGFLADRRTTFYRALSVADSYHWPEEIEIYSETGTTPELEALAIASAEQSRFRVDPRVPRPIFESLYRQWIENSVNGTIADATLVVRDHDTIVAMATVAEKNGRSDIGLIAVDAAHRGRSHGTRLMQAAHHWARERGLADAQVVTQGDNRSARRLYEKCGYTVERVEHYYHFWLTMEPGS